MVVCKTNVVNNSKVGKITNVVDHPKALQLPQVLNAIPFDTQVTGMHQGSTPTRCMTRSLKYRAKLKG